VIRRRFLSLEAKYALCACAIVVGLLTFGRLDVVTRAGNELMSVMNSFASLGLLGIFAVALVANMSLFLQIPYTLPLLSAAIGGATLARMTSLGLAAGLGAACGALISYRLAHVVLARNPELPSSSMFRWIERLVDRHPRKTIGVILLVLVTPLPDDAVIVPLATVRYGFRRFVPLALVGKVAHNLLVALVFSAFALWAKGQVPRSASVNIGLGLMGLFVLAILYQAEKARTRAEGATTTETSNASA
jgi:membrane protein YqaA with SNARE-associated domain